MNSENILTTSPLFPRTLRNGGASLTMNEAVVILKAFPHRSAVLSLIGSSTRNPTLSLWMVMTSRISVMLHQLCSLTKTQATSLLLSLLFHPMSLHRIRVPSRTSPEQCRLWHNPSPWLPSSRNNNLLLGIYLLRLHISLVPPRH